jgi:hypothetical protein
MLWLNIHKKGKEPEGKLLQKTYKKAKLVENSTNPFQTIPIDHKNIN